MNFKLPQVSTNYLLTQILPQLNWSDSSTNIYDQLLTPILAMVPMLELPAGHHQCLKVVKPRVVVPAYNLSPQETKSRG